MTRNERALNWITKQTHPHGHWVEMLGTRGGMPVMGERQRWRFWRHEIAFDRVPDWVNAELRRMHEDSDGYRHFNDEGDFIVRHRDQYGHKYEDKFWVDFDEEKDLWIVSETTWDEYKYSRQDKEVERRYKEKYPARELTAAEKAAEKAAAKAAAKRFAKMSPSARRRYYRMN